MGDRHGSGGINYNWMHRRIRPHYCTQTPVRRRTATVADLFLSGSRLFEGKSTILNSDDDRLRRAVGRVNRILKKNRHLSLVWDYKSLRIVHLASSDSLFRTQYSVCDFYIRWGKLSTGVLYSASVATFLLVWSVIILPIYILLREIIT